MRTKKPRAWCWAWAFWGADCSLSISAMDLLRFVPLSVSPSDCIPRPPSPTAAACTAALASLRLAAGDAAAKGSLGKDRDSGEDPFPAPAPASASAGGGAAASTSSSAASAASASSARAPAAGAGAATAATPSTGVFTGTGGVAPGSAPPRRRHIAGRWSGEVHALSRPVTRYLRLCCRHWSVSGGWTCGARGARGGGDRGEIQVPGLKRLPRHPLTP